MSRNAKLFIFAPFTCFFTRPLFFCKQVDKVLDKNFLKRDFVGASCVASYQKTIDEEIFQIYTLLELFANRCDSGYVRRGCDVPESRFNDELFVSQLKVARKTFLVCETIFRLNLAKLNKFIVKFNQLLSLKLKIKFISPSSSSRSRKMFIGGLSWQTSPGMFTSDIDFFQSVLIQMASKYEKFIGPKLKY